MLIVLFFLWFGGGWSGKKVFLSGTDGLLGSINFFFSVYSFMNSRRLLFDELIYKKLKCLFI